MINLSSLKKGSIRIHIKYRLYFSAFKNRSFENNFVEKVNVIINLK